MRTTSLRISSALKDTTGGTVNDMVWRCAGGLRQYLLAHDALPDVHCGPWFRCRSAPVRRTTRGPTGCRLWSPICPPIVPIRSNGLPGAARRCGRQASLDLVPADDVVDITQFSAPGSRPPRCDSPRGSARPTAIAQPFNLVTPNVPGPVSRCIWRGPTVPPVSGVDRHRRAGTQYHGRQLLRTGSTSASSSTAIWYPTCRSRRPAHRRDGRLFDASGAEWVQPPQPAHPRRGRVGRGRLR